MKMYKVSLKPIVVSFFILSTMTLGYVSAQYHSNSTVDDQVELKKNKTISIEKKFSNKITIDDEFAENRIIVVLNRQETMEFRDWTVNDFSEIDVALVENLTNPSAEIVRADFNRKKQAKQKRVEMLDLSKILQLTQKNFGQYFDLR